MRSAEVRQGNFSGRQSRLEQNARKHRRRELIELLFGDAVDFMLEVFSMRVFGICLIFGGAAFAVWFLSKFFGVVPALVFISGAGSLRVVFFLCENQRGRRMLLLLVICVVVMLVCLLFR